MIGEYDFMILSFGGSMIVFALSFQFLLPASLDMHTDSYGGDHDGEEIEEEGSQVSKMELVMDPNYLFALITQGYGLFAL